MKVTLHEIAENCVCLNVRRTARLITRSYDRALAPLGLRATQFGILATLQLAGDTPMGKLATYQDLERTTLTRNLVPLERDGLLLTTRGNTKDSRVKVVSITAKGTNILHQAIPLWEKAQRDALVSLGSPELAKKLSVIAKEMDHEAKYAN